IDAIRVRELPSGEDRPPAKRRAKGQPGYTGRHRGEHRQRMVPVLHDGSGLWLALHWLALEGSIVPCCRALIDTARRTLAALGQVWGVIARGDGEFGSVGAMRALIDAGAHPLVRLSRYPLLDHEPVAAHLRTVAWDRVRSGDSGVPRDAAELGTFT